MRDRKRGTGADEGVSLRAQRLTYLTHLPYLTYPTYLTYLPYPPLLSPA